MCIVISRYGRSELSMCKNTKKYQTIKVITKNAGK